MPSSLIVRGSTNLTTGGTYTKVNSTPLIASGTLRTKSGNSGTVAIRSTLQTTPVVILEAGAEFWLEAVDLSTIELTGSAASQGYEFVGTTARGLTA